MGDAPNTDTFASLATSSILFYLNGTRISLDASAIDPDATLLDFIRSQGPGLTGTKLGCGEGGCGACTVVIQNKHPRTGILQHLAVNACLAPIVSVDGKHVITVEGLGNSENPHPLQERMWKMSGSQCGFCTPGIIMSLYALLRTAYSDPAKLGRLTVEDIELNGALDGNLCRCTGYKTILDSAKTFVGEYLARAQGGKLDEDFTIPVNYKAANLEEGEVVSCCKVKPSEPNPAELSSDIALPVPSGEETSVPPIDKNSSATGRTAPVVTSAVKENSVPTPTPIAPTSPSKGCGRADCCQLSSSSSSNEVEGKSKKHPRFPRFTFRPYKPNTELIFPPALNNYKLKPLKFGNDDRVWLRPTTVEQLAGICQVWPAAKLVGGSSEIQIEVKLKAQVYPVSVYVSDIPELYFIEPPMPERPSFEFGANLPLAELEVTCKSLIDAPNATYAKGPLEAIRTQLRYFAGWQIRNVASVGGNIATASPISDLNPVWIAVDAKVVARTAEGQVELSMDDFFIGYRKTRLPKSAIIERIVVPLGGGPREVVKAYKQAKRRDDDIAIVTSCFAMRVNDEGIIEHAKFAYGGMAAWTISTPKTQAFVIGKPFTYQVLEAALEELAAEIDLPFNVPGGMPSFRKTLALSFLFKFWNAVSVELDIPLDGGQAMLSADPQDIISTIHRQANTGRRDNSDPYAEEVVGKSEPHLSGLKHTTGEAVYTDDMPTLQNEGYGALVLSTRAHAKIISVDASKALEMKGVYTFVSHLDLPSPKANWWGSVALDEVFFAVDEVTAYGQPIGMIVAQTKIQAQKAARAVEVVYEDNGPPILTIEEAIEKGSFHMQYERRIARGDEIDGVLGDAECTAEGTTRMGGQEHFYLETMACLAVPKFESGEMEVFASTQALTDSQRWVAQVTGVPRNRILARSKRLGGGFGGKETRASHLTAITALAAKKSRRPVRCMLDRSEDIQTTGQRHPFLVNWKVGFTSEGKITALKADAYANAGYSLDISGGVIDRALAHIENCFYIPHVDVRGRCCKTNTVSNTAFRGFGGPQGMAVSEHFVEVVSHHLGLDIDHVREINLYKEGQETPYHQEVLDWHVPRLLQDCRISSNYDHRRAEVDRFNEEHRWRKRGIVLIPTKFGLAFGIKAMNQGAALVHIYMDGSVLVAHGGTEMGQGLYTKCCQLAAQELRVPLEAVFTSESSTNTVPNTVPTAGSAGSDLQGYAVHNACVELNRRLEPYRQKLGSDASLASLAAAAWGDRVSLSATGHYEAPGLGYEWNNMKKTGNLFMYFTQGVAATEVEVDTLTGDHTVLRVDIHMDVGKSLNPAIDYGQIEGAFTQGQGWATIEESLWLRHNGAIFTQGPGAYKLPGFSDIPQVFNVSLLRDAEWPNLGSIKASKGIGEPPLFLGASVALAIRYALKSARKDAGITDVQEFRLPMTSERIRMAAGDFLAKKGLVEDTEGRGDGFFVTI
ncbi:xanthine dehydrogenase [Lyophyllum atratum]|nr:xanthine dehydrogenase [Lyophyllum atratum]